MVPSTQQPIERRPVTSRQARRQWQKKGCPTISSAEKRRLQREAELERRAEKIRNDEKRKKENAKKRKEKEERDRKTRKRMGYQEEIKLPEGQLGLGQFFTSKGTGIELRATSMQQETKPSAFRSTETASLLQQGNGKEKPNTEPEDERENGEDSDEESDEDDTAQGVPLSVEVSSVDRRQPGQPFVNATELTAMGGKGKIISQQALDTDKTPNGQLPDNQHARSAFDSGGATVGVRVDLDAITTFSSQPRTRARPANSELMLLSGGDAKRRRSFESREPLLAMELTVSEKNILLRRSTSLPSRTSKRDLQQAAFELDTEIGADQTSTALSRKRRRTTSLSINPVNIPSVGNVSDILRKPDSTPDLVILSQNSNPRKSVTAIHDTKPIGASDEPSSDTQREPESFSNGLLDGDFDMLMDLSQQSKLSKPESSIEHPDSTPPGETFGNQTDDFKKQVQNDSDDQENNKLSALQTIKGEIKRSSRSPSKRKSFSRTESSQSYGYDFSSQDYNDLEAIIAASPVKGAHPSLPTMLKSTTPARQTSTNTLSFDDNFDLPGCTQALAALADLSSQESPTKTPKTSQETQPRTPPKTSMLPPPIPQRRPSPPKRVANDKQRTNSMSAVANDADDAYDCFDGSTQALLEL